MECGWYYALKRVLCGLRCRIPGVAPSGAVHLARGPVVLQAAWIPPCLLSLAAQVDVRRRDNIHASTSAAAYLMVLPSLKNAGPVPSQRFLARDERDRPVTLTTSSKDSSFMEIPGVG